MLKLCRDTIEATPEERIRFLEQELERTKIELQREQGNRITSWLRYAEAWRKQAGQLHDAQHDGDVILGKLLATEEQLQRDYQGGSPVLNEIVAIRLAISQWRAHILNYNRALENYYVHGRKMVGEMLAQKFPGSRAAEIMR